MNAQKIETRLAILANSLTYMGKREMAKVIDLGPAEISTLRAQNEKLREALRKSKNLMDYWKSHHPIEWEKEDEEVYQEARAILKETESK